MWFKTAWNDIAPESTIMEFKKCCVSNITGPEGDVLWQKDHDKNCVSGNNDSVGTE